MKTLNLLFTLMLCLVITTALAQVTKTSSAPSNDAPPDQNSIVRDSVGKVYSFTEWRPLMMSRAYVMRSQVSKNGNLEYTLIKLSEKELALRGITKNTVSQRMGVAYTPPDENSIVKDSSGTVYPYIVWHKLFQSGDYSMRSRSDGTGPITYMLVRRSQQEKDRMMAMMPRPKDSDTFKVGDVFSPFKDKDLSGQKIDIKALAGKVIVLNFWFIGCPPCRAEIPDLNKLSQAYKDNNDVVFVAIALDEGYDIKDFVKTNPLGYHLLDNGKYLAGKYGVKFYPTNVVIGRDGKVAYSSQGGWPGNPYWIQKTIDQSLSTAAVTKMAAQ